MGRRKTTKAAKVSISMPPEMYAAAKERAAALGMDSFSDYIKDLLREDLHRRGNRIRHEDPKA